MKYKQRATITSIKDLNKNFEVKMIEFQLDFTLTLEGEDAVNVLPIPKGKLGDYLEVGDLVEFKMNKNQKNCEMFNLSCQFLMLSKFKRDLTSILRRFNNYDHPLNRCIILSEPVFVLLSAKKNADKVRLISEATKIIEDNHAKF